MVLLIVQISSEFKINIMLPRENPPELNPDYPTDLMDIDAEKE